jgi:hypothetical protein
MATQPIQGDFAEGVRTMPEGPPRDFAEGLEHNPPGPPRDFAEGLERKRDAEDTRHNTRAA